MRPVYPKMIVMLLAVLPHIVSAQAAPRTSAAAAPAKPVAAPNPEVYLVPLSGRSDALKIGVPANVSRRYGYDNQPAFSRDSRALYFTSNRGDGQTDIYRNDFSDGLTTPARATQPESEYSAFPTLDGTALTVIRVEADSTQRLWQFPNDGAAPTVLFPGTKPVGYFAQADDSTWAMFVLGSPATLHLGRTSASMPAGGTTTEITKNVGRSLHRIPGTTHVSFVQKGGPTWYVMRLDPASRRIDTLVALPKGSEDVAWVDSTTLLVGRAAELLVWRRGATEWSSLGDLSYAHLASITRLAVSPSGQWLAMVAEAQPRPASAVPRSKTPARDAISAASVKRNIGILAADSMEGRMTGSRGQERAARWLEAQYEAAGLTPAGDSGTFRQHIPLRMARGPGGAPGRTRPAPVASWSAWDSLPAEQRLRTSNVAAMIRGSDPTLRDEVVLVTAHYDHIGIRDAMNGDSINNGADDDASGNVALVEMAKALMKGARPKRTILFLSITGEEVGGFGTSWYIRHPLLPLEKTIVDLNVEMIAHADSLAGGFGKAWLTGYERSTLGDMLADNGIPLVPDPRPGQNFFSRSDNVAFARIGIPAHSLSSYNLSTPYHSPKDEASIVDVPHMTEVISVTTKAVRLLANGPRPAWHPGGRPDAPAPRPSR